MPPPSNLLRIGAFAELANTNLRTLRYYEEVGLLSPAHRSQGGFRYYRPTDLARIQLIQFLQDMGLQLEEIGEWLKDIPARGSREEWVANLSKILANHMQLIENRIAKLGELRERVAESASHLEVCKDCDLIPREENNFCHPCGSTGAALPEFLSAIF